MGCGDCSSSCMCITDTEILICNIYSFWRFYVPNFKNSEKVIVNKIGYKVGDIDNGDVIVFHANKNDDYVKRVIGKPGDTVKYENDQLYVNDKKYLKNT